MPVWFRQYGRYMMWVGGLLCLMLGAGCEDSSLPVLDAAGVSDADTTETAATDLGAVEGQTYAAVNTHRASIGAEWLSWSEPMASVARQHSQEIASGAISMGHVGAQDRIAILSSSLGIESYGENEAMTPSVDGAINGWLDSPSHRANMERSFTITGVGASVQADGRYIITQIFASQ